VVLVTLFKEKNLIFRTTKTYNIRKNDEKKHENEKKLALTRKLLGNE